jgi:hypothetical protein
VSVRGWVGTIVATVVGGLLLWPKGQGFAALDWAMRFLAWAAGSVGIPRWVLGLLVLVGAAMLVAIIGLGRHRRAPEKVLEPQAEPLPDIPDPPKRNRDYGAYTSPMEGDETEILWILWHADGKWLHAS